MHGNPGTCMIGTQCHTVHGTLLLFKNPEMAACFRVEAQALGSDKPQIKSCYTFCSLCDWNQASHNISEPHSSSVKRNSQSP